MKTRRGARSPARETAARGCDGARRQRAAGGRLGHGRANASALDLANAVLTGVAGLDRLARARYDELRRIPGNRRRASRADRRGGRTGPPDADARSAASASRSRLLASLAEMLLPQYGSRAVEQFGVVLLDTKHRVLRTTVVTVGTLDASIVHPREIFREAASAGAAAIVLFHNHPSGDPEPSQDDVTLTRRVVAAGILMGIDVVDHVILADARYCSLREKGLL